MAYKEDLKVHILSPSLRIIDHLKSKNLFVQVQDPYYSSEEIKSITNLESFNYPNDLQKFDCIVITPGHREYKITPKDVLLENLKNCRLIIDNPSVWFKWKEDFKKMGIKYILIGDKNWMSR